MNDEKREDIENKGFTGEQLYELYEQANNDMGASIDTYGDLPELDRGIWDQFASLLQMGVI